MNIQKPQLCVLTCFLVAACATDPVGDKQNQNITEDGGGGGGSSSGDGGSGGDPSGTGGSPAETALEEAVREFCKIGCECYECAHGTEGCIEERGEPTGKGAECDALLALQMSCVTAAMQGCPSNMNIEETMINCAPPMEEQEAACGPGGIPG